MQVAEFQDPGTTLLRPSDQQIIDRFQASRNAVDLNPLMERHLGRVRRMAWDMVLDDEAADEVTQEVFLRVIRGLASFESRSQFTTWLYRITMNTAHSYLRKKSIQHKHQVAKDDEPESELGTSRELSPEGRLMSVELKSNVHQAIQALSPKLRAAIVLTAIHGMSAAEAADIEDCPADTIYGRVHQARKQLKHQLREHLNHE